MFFDQKCETTMYFLDIAYFQSNSEGSAKSPKAKSFHPLVTFIFPGYRVNDDPNTLFQQMEIFYEMTSQFPKEYAYVASLPRFRCYLQYICSKRKKCATTYLVCKVRG